MSAHSEQAPAGRADAHAAHAHGQPDYDARFALGIALNVLFIGAEIAFGILGNSMALLADAGHNVSDVLGLAVAWGAAVLSRRPPDDRFTYGLRGSSILAAMLNGVLLLVAAGAIAWEAIGRIVDPEPVAGATVVVVAAAGILINGATAWLFASGRHTDLNIRGAFLHMAADAAVSAGVVVSGLAMIATSWLWVDPAVSLVVVAVIGWSTWGLLRDSVAMSQAAVPDRINMAAVRTFLETRDGVAGAHHIHVWPTSTTEVALTAHLLLPEGHPGDAFIRSVVHDLKDRFGIDHATLQIEVGDGQAPAARPGE